MNPLSRIRRLRWLPRAALAVLALATVQTALLPCAMAAEVSEHCVYCPPEPAPQNECAYPDSPAVDIPNGANMGALFGGTLLHSLSFNLSEQRYLTSVHSVLDIAPPARPLNLTHCVQLR